MPPMSSSSSSHPSSSSSASFSPMASTSSTVAPATPTSAGPSRYAGSSEGSASTSSITSSTASATVFAVPRAKPSPRTSLSPLTSAKKPPIRVVLKNSNSSTQVSGPQQQTSSSEPPSSIGPDPNRNNASSQKPKSLKPDVSIAKSSPTSPAINRGVPEGNAPSKRSDQASPKAVTPSQSSGLRDRTPALRVSVTTLKEEQLSKLIEAHVEEKGLPLVISDLETLPEWDAKDFHFRSYQDFFGDDRAVDVTRLADGSRFRTVLSSFMDHCEKTPSYSETSTERLYGDDLRFPSAWDAKLQSILPPRLVPYGAADAFSSLAPHIRPETRTCSFGAGGTFLPQQRGLCSSIGQSLMVSSDPEAESTWLLTRPDDAEKVDEYIRGLEADPTSDLLSLKLEDAQNMPFTLFVCVQKVGDLVVIPARSTQFVLNSKGRALKVSWSRLTVDSLEKAMQIDLPLYQRICRQEGYRIKTLIEETLGKLTQRIQQDVASSTKVPVHVLIQFRTVLTLYDQIISDVFVADWRKLKVEGTSDSYVECDFCGADVLLSYFECIEGHTICAMCYSQGRLCPCENAVVDLQPRQLATPFDKRLELRNTAAALLNAVEPKDADEIPIDVLEEKDIAKTAWPHSFMAACKLFKIRTTQPYKEERAQCKMCKAEDLDLASRYKCKPCHYSYCFGCLLHRTYISPVHVLAQNNVEQFHSYHKNFSKMDYKEWKEDPAPYRMEAQAHFAIIEAAIVHKKCAPLNPGCRIGFLDVSPNYPAGLTGTLGIKRKAKDSSLKPSGSGKRQIELVQDSSSSPRSTTSKRAKTTPSTEEDAGTAASVATSTEVASQTGQTPSSASPFTPKRNGVSVPLPTPPVPTSTPAEVYTPTRLVHPPSTVPSQGIGSSSGVRAIPAANSNLKITITNGKARPMGIVPDQSESASPSASASSSRKKVPAQLTTAPTAAQTASDVSPARVGRPASSVHPGPVAPPATANDTTDPRLPPPPTASRAASAASSKGPGGDSIANGSALSSLDSRNLRVLTEILSIFSKDVNQKAMDRHDELMRKMEEQAQNHDKILREIRLVRSDQAKLSSQLNDLDRRQRETELKVSNIAETLGELMGDIHRGAQARLELENKSQNSSSSVSESSVSGGASSSNPFHNITSNIRKL